MGDLGGIIREFFVGEPGLAPGLDVEPLAERVAALDSRMATVRSLSRFIVGLMVVVAVIMVVLLVTADDGTAVKWLVLYGSLIVWAAVAIAMAKLWQLHAASAARVEKEVLRAQAIVRAGQQG